MRALAQRQTRHKPNALVLPLPLPLPLAVGRFRGRRPGGPIALVGEERPELAGDRRQGLRTQHRDALEPPLERGVLVAPAPPVARRARPPAGQRPVGPLGAGGLGVGGETRVVEDAHFAHQCTQAPEANMYRCRVLGRRWARDRGGGGGGKGAITARRREGRHEPRAAWVARQGRRWLRGARGGGGGHGREVGDAYVGDRQGEKADALEDGSLAPGEENECIAPRKVGARHKTHRPVFQLVAPEGAHGNVSLLFEVPDPNRPEATDGHHRAPLRTRRPAAHQGGSGAAIRPKVHAPAANDGAGVRAGDAHLAEVIHGDQPRNRRVREAADEPLVLQLGNDLLQRRHFELGGLGLVSLHSRRGRTIPPKNEALDSDSLPREGTSFKQKIAFAES
mmetsp:Transcript_4517/g.6629  ORF Transcript_4517/g.6629 Transcript_4517/m.6629 type:complete len:393 (+) Transcript_4517:181-1359(+)